MVPINYSLSIIYEGTTSWINSFHCSPKLYSPWCFFFCSFSHVHMKSLLLIIHLLISYFFISSTYLPINSFSLRSYTTQSFHLFSVSLPPFHHLLLASLSVCLCHYYLSWWRFQTNTNYFPRFSRPPSLLSPSLLSLQHCHLCYMHSTFLRLLGWTSFRSICHYRLYYLHVICG